MKGLIQSLFSLGLLAMLSSNAAAQGTSVYPPADGNFYFNPPLFAGPGAVGAQYLELFPVYYGLPNADRVAPAEETETAEADFTGTSQRRPKPTAKAKAAARAIVPPVVVMNQVVGAGAGIRPKNPRTVRPRVYQRGYNQGPLPYDSQLPQGQLTWPGNGMVPGYSPINRYQNYGQAYGKGPYGSGFYAGYWHGLPIIIGD